MISSVGSRYMAMVDTKQGRVFTKTSVASSPTTSYLVTALLTKYYSNMTMTRSSGNRKDQGQRRERESKGTETRRARAHR